MAYNFKKIINSGRGSLSGAMATFIKNARGDGSLRLNRVGVEYLLTNRIKIFNETKVELLIDEELGAIAVNVSDDGTFIFKSVGKDSVGYRISSKSLSEAMKFKRIKYGIKLSEDPNNYDFILEPIEKEK